MGESGGDNREQRDEISLLSEELIQLSVKGSRVVPDDKPTLIWQNLYLIVFELEEDLELIMEVGHGFFERALRLEELLDLKLAKNGVYEKLPLFCYGCGRLGHGIPDCSVLSAAEKSKVKDDPPFTMALKAESNLVGKEVIQFNDLSKKDRTQVSYTGDSENGRFVDIINEEANNCKEVLYGRPQVGDEEKMLKNQVDVATAIIDEKMRVDESDIKKRKATEGRLEIFNVEDDYGDGTKRQKKEQEKDLGDMLAKTMRNIMDQNEVQLIMGSAAAKRQADRTQ
ncbi:hypothetical protein Gohar_021612 [Gossypium harknessii]|uniref:CCHC-type domain-containing protein n=1 Tax=Gossypium harknessii TaxID=34285 RepID=A0A7J9IBV5_9ROSI|nr:hypothetical protein [Gossypium harknessii]